MADTPNTKGLFQGTEEEEDEEERRKRLAAERFQQNFANQQTPQSTQPKTSSPTTLKLGATTSEPIKQDASMDARARAASAFAAGYVSEKPNEPYASNKDVILSSSSLYESSYGITTYDDLINKVKLNPGETYTQYVERGGAIPEGFEYASRLLIAEEKRKDDYNEYLEGNTSYEDFLMRAYGNDILKSEGIDFEDPNYWSNRIANGDYSDPRDNVKFMQDILAASESLMQQDSWAKQSKTDTCADIGLSDILTAKDGTIQINGMELTGTQLETMTVRQLFEDQFDALDNYYGAIDGNIETETKASKEIIKMYRAGLLNAFNPIIYMNNNGELTANTPIEDGTNWRAAYYYHTDGKLYAIEGSGAKGKSKAYAYYDDNGKLERITLNSNAGWEVAQQFTAGAFSLVTETAAAIGALGGGIVDLFEGLFGGGFEPDKLTACYATVKQATNSSRILGNDAYIANAGIFRDDGSVNMTNVWRGVSYGVGAIAGMLATAGISAAVSGAALGTSTAASGVANTAAKGVASTAAKSLAKNAVSSGVKRGALRTVIGKSAAFVNKTVALSGGGANLFVKSTASAMAKTAETVTVLALKDFVSSTAAIHANRAVIAEANGGQYDWFEDAVKPALFMTVVNAGISMALRSGINDIGALQRLGQFTEQLNPSSKFSSWVNEMLSSSKGRLQLHAYETTMDIIENALTAWTSASVENGKKFIFDGDTAISLISSPQFLTMQALSGISAWRGSIFTKDSEGVSTGSIKDRFFNLKTGVVDKVELALTNAIAKADVDRLKGVDGAQTRFEELIKLRQEFADNISSKDTVLEGYMTALEELHKKISDKSGNSIVTDALKNLVTEREIKIASIESKYAYNQYKGLYERYKETLGEAFNGKALSSFLKHSEYIASQMYAFFESNADTEAKREKLKFLDIKNAISTVLSETSTVKAITEAGYSDIDINQFNIHIMNNNIQYDDAGNIKAIDEIKESFGVGKDTEAQFEDFLKRTPEEQRQNVILIELKGKGTSDEGGEKYQKASKLMEAICKLADLSAKRVNESKDNDGNIDLILDALPFVEKIGDNFIAIRPDSNIFASLFGNVSRAGEGMDILAKLHASVMADSLNFSRGAEDDVTRVIQLAQIFNKDTTGANIKKSDVTLDSCLDIIETLRDSGYLSISAAASLLRTFESQGAFTFNNVSGDISNSNFIKQFGIAEIEYDKVGDFKNKLENSPAYIYMKIEDDRARLAELQEEGNLTTKEGKNIAEDIQEKLYDSNGNLNEVGKRIKESNPDFIKALDKLIKEAITENPHESQSEQIIRTVFQKLAESERASSGGSDNKESRRVVVDNLAKILSDSQEDSEKTSAKIKFNTVFERELEELFENAPQGSDSTGEIYSKALSNALTNLIASKQITVPHDYKTFPTAAKANILLLDFINEIDQSIYAKILEDALSVEIEKQIDAETIRLSKLNRNNSNKLNDLFLIQLDISDAKSTQNINEKLYILNKLLSNTDKSIQQFIKKAISNATIKDFFAEIASIDNTVNPRDSYLQIAMDMATTIIKDYSVTPKENYYRTALDTAYKDYNRIYGDTKLKKGAAGVQISLGIDGLVGATMRKLFDMQSSDNFTISINDIKDSSIRKSLDTILGKGASSKLIAELRVMQELYEQYPNGIISFNDKNDRRLADLLQRLNYDSVDLQGNRLSDIQGVYLSGQSEHVISVDLNKGKTVRDAILHFKSAASEHAYNAEEKSTTIRVDAKEVLDSSFGYWESLDKTAPIKLDKPVLYAGYSGNTSEETHIRFVTDADNTDVLVGINNKVLGAKQGGQASNIGVNNSGIGVASDIDTDMLQFFIGFKILDALKKAGPQLIETQISAEDIKAFGSIQAFITNINKAGIWKATKIEDQGKAVRYSLELTDNFEAAARKFLANSEANNKLMYMLPILVSSNKNTENSRTLYGTANIGETDNIAAQQLLAAVRAELDANQIYADTLDAALRQKGRKAKVAASSEEAVAELYGKTIDELAALNPKDLSIEAQMTRNALLATAYANNKLATQYVDNLKASIETEISDDTAQEALHLIGSNVFRKALGAVLNKHFDDRDTFIKIFTDSNISREEKIKALKEVLQECKTLTTLNSEEADIYRRSKLLSNPNEGLGNSKIATQQVLSSNIIKLLQQPPIDLIASLTFKDTDITIGLDDSRIDGVLTAIAAILESSKQLSTEKTVKYFNSDYSNTNADVFNVIRALNVTEESKTSLDISVDQLVRMTPDDHAELLKYLKSAATEESYKAIAAKIDAIQKSPIYKYSASESKQPTAIKQLQHSANQASMEANARGILTDISNPELLKKTDSLLRSFVKNATNNKKKIKKSQLKLSEIEAIQRLDSKLFYRLAQKFKEDISLHVDKPGSILIERLDTEEGLSKFVATLSNIVENLENTKGISDKISELKKALIAAETDAKNAGDSEESNAKIAAAADALSNYESSIFNIALKLYENTTGMDFQKEYTGFIFVDTKTGEILSTAQAGERIKYQDFYVKTFETKTDYEDSDIICFHASKNAFTDSGDIDISRLEYVDLSDANNLHLIAAATERYADEYYCFRGLPSEEDASTSRIITALSKTPTYKDYTEAAVTSAEAITGNRTEAEKIIALIGDHSPESPDNTERIQRIYNTHQAYFNMQAAEEGTDKRANRSLKRISDFGNTGLIPENIPQSLLSSIRLQLSNKLPTGLKEPANRIYDALINSKTVKVEGSLKSIFDEEFKTFYEKKNGKDSFKTLSGETLEKERELFFGNIIKYIVSHSSDVNAISFLLTNGAEIYDAKTGTTKSVRTHKISRIEEARLGKTETVNGIETPIEIKDSIDITVELNGTQVPISRILSDMSIPKSTYDIEAVYKSESEEDSQIFQIALQTRFENSGSDIEAKIIYLPIYGEDGKIVKNYDSKIYGYENEFHKNFPDFWKKYGKQGDRVNSSIVGYCNWWNSLDDNMKKLISTKESFEAHKTEILTELFKQAGILTSEGNLNKAVLKEGTAIIGFNHKNFDNKQIKALLESCTDSKGLSDLLKVLTNNPIDVFEIVSKFDSALSANIAEDLQGKRTLESVYKALDKEGKIDFSLKNQTGNTAHDASADIMMTYAVLDAYNKLITEQVKLPRDKVINDIDTLGSEIFGDSWRPNSGETSARLRTFKDIEDFLKVSTDGDERIILNKSDAAWLERYRENFADPEYAAKQLQFFSVLSSRDLERERIATAKKIREESMKEMTSTDAAILNYVTSKDGSEKVSSIFKEAIKVYLKTSNKDLIVLKSLDKNDVVSYSSTMLEIIDGANNILFDIINANKNGTLAYRDVFEFIKTTPYEKLLESLKAVKGSQSGTKSLQDIVDESDFSTDSPRENLGSSGEMLDNYADIIIKNIKTACSDSSDSLSNADLEIRNRLYAKKEHTYLSMALNGFKKTMSGFFSEMFKDLDLDDSGKERLQNELLSMYMDIGDTSDESSYSKSIREKVRTRVLDKGSGAAELLEYLRDNPLVQKKFTSVYQMVSTGLSNGSARKAEINTDIDIIDSNGNKKTVKALANAIYISPDVFKKLTGVDIKNAGNAMGEDGYFYIPAMRYPLDKESSLRVVRVGVVDTDSPIEMTSVQLDYFKAVFNGDVDGDKISIIWMPLSSRLKDYYKACFDYSEASWGLFSNILSSDFVRNYSNIDISKAHLLADNNFYYNKKFGVVTILDKLNKAENKTEARKIYEDAKKAAIEEYGDKLIESSWIQTPKDLSQAIDTMGATSTGYYLKSNWIPMTEAQKLQYGYIIEANRKATERLYIASYFMSVPRAEFDSLSGTSQKQANSSIETVDGKFEDIFYFLPFRLTDSSYNMIDAILSGSDKSKFKDMLIDAVKTNANSDKHLLAFIDRIEDSSGFRMFMNAYDSTVRRVHSDTLTELFKATLDNPDGQNEPFIDVLKTLAKSYGTTSSKKTGEVYNIEELLRSSEVFEILSDIVNPHTKQVRYSTGGRDDSSAELVSLIANKFLSDAIQSSRTEYTDDMPEGTSVPTTIIFNFKPNIDIDSEDAFYRLNTEASNSIKVRAAKGIQVSSKFLKGYKNSLRTIATLNKVESVAKKLGDKETLIEVQKLKDKVNENHEIIFSGVDTSTGILIFTETRGLSGSSKIATKASKQKGSISPKIIDIKTLGAENSALRKELENASLITSSKNLKEDSLDTSVIEEYLDNNDVKFYSSTGKDITSIIKQSTSKKARLTREKFSEQDIAYMSVKMPLVISEELGMTRNDVKTGRMIDLGGIGMNRRNPYAPVLLGNQCFSVNEDGTLRYNSELQSAFYRAMTSNDYLDKPMSNFSYAYKLLLATTLKKVLAKDANTRDLLERLINSFDYLNGRTGTNALLNIIEKVGWESLSKDKSLSKLQRALFNEDLFYETFSPKESSIIKDSGAGVQSKNAAKRGELTNKQIVSSEAEGAKSWRQQQAITDAETKGYEEAYLDETDGYISSLDLINRLIRLANDDDSNDTKIQPMYDKYAQLVDSEGYLPLREGLEGGQATSFKNIDKRAAKIVPAERYSNTNEKVGIAESVTEVAKKTIVPFIADIAEVTSDTKAFKSRQKTMEGLGIPSIAKESLEEWLYRPSTESGAYASTNRGRLENMLIASLFGTGRTIQASEFFRPTTNLYNMPIQRPIYSPNEEGSLVGKFAFGNIKDVPLAELSALSSKNTASTQYGAITSAKKSNVEPLVEGIIEESNRTPTKTIVKNGKKVEVEYTEKDFEFAKISDELQQEFKQIDAKCMTPESESLNMVRENKKTASVSRKMEHWRYGDDDKLKVIIKADPLSSAGVRVDSQETFDIEQSIMNFRKNGASIEFQLKKKFNHITELAAKYNALDELNTYTWILYIKDVLLRCDSREKTANSNREKNSITSIRKSALDTLASIGGLEGAEQKIKSFETIYPEIVSSYRDYMETLVNVSSRYSRDTGETTNPFFLLSPVVPEDKSLGGSKNAEAAVKLAAMFSFNSDILAEGTQNKISALPVYNFLGNQEAVISHVAKFAAVANGSAGLKRAGFMDNAKIADIVRKTFNDYIANDKEGTIKELDKIFNGDSTAKSADTLHNFDDMLNQILSDSFGYFTYNKKHSGSITQDYIDLALAAYSRAAELSDSVKSEVDTDKQDEIKFASDALKMYANDIMAVLTIKASDISNNKGQTSFLDVLYDNIKNHADANGYALTDEFGREFTEDAREYRSISAYSLSYIKEMMDIYTSVSNNDTYKRKIALKILSGDAYFMSKSLADTLKEKVYTTKVPPKAIEAIRKSTDLCIKLIMSNPMKLLDRIAMYSGFDYATLSAADLSTIAYAGQANKEFRAFRHSGGAAMTSNLKEFLFTQGIDPEKTDFSKLKSDGVIETTGSKRIKGLSDYFDFTNKTFTYQTLATRYAFWLASVNKMRNNKEVTYGSAYYNKKYIDNMQDVKDANGNKIVSAEGAKAAYIMAQNLGAPGDFPELSRTLGSYGMAFTSFPLQQIRWLRGEIKSLGSAIKTIAGSTLDGASNSKYSAIKHLFTTGLGLAAPAIINAALYAILSEMYNIPEEEKEDLGETTFYNGQTNLETLRKNQAALKPFSSLIQGAPVFDNYNSINPLASLNDMFIEPITDAISDEEKQSSEDGENFSVTDTLGRATAGLLLENGVSHLPPVIKGLGEAILGVDIIGTNISKSTEGESFVNNLARKIGGYTIGATGTSRMIEYLQSEANADETTAQRFAKGLSYAIGAELGNTKIYKQNEKNYQRASKLIDNYKNILRKNTENTYESNWDFATIGTLKNKIQSLIKNNGTSADVYRVLTEAIEDSSLSFDEIKYAAETSSLYYKISRLKDPEAFMSSLTEEDKDAVKEALLYEQEVYPWLNTTIADVINTYSDNEDFKYYSGNPKSMYSYMSTIRGFAPSNSYTYKNKRYSGYSKNYAPRTYSRKSYANNKNYINNYRKNIYTPSNYLSLPYITQPYQKMFYSNNYKKYDTRYTPTQTYNYLMAIYNNTLEKEKYSNKYDFNLD